MLVGDGQAGGKSPLINSEGKVGVFNDRGMTHADYLFKEGRLVRFFYETFKVTDIAWRITEFGRHGNCLFGVGGMS
jgi:hypothetical protein